MALRVTGVRSIPCCSVSAPHLHKAKLYRFDLTVPPECTFGSGRWQSVSRSARRHAEYGQPLFCLVDDTDEPVAAVCIASYVQGRLDQTFEVTLAKHRLVVTPQGPVHWAGSATRLRFALQIPRGRQTLATLAVVLLTGSLTTLGLPRPRWLPPPKGQPCPAARPTVTLVWPMEVLMCGRAGRSNNPTDAALLLLDGGMCTFACVDTAPFFADDDEPDRWETEPDEEEYQDWPPLTTLAPYCVVDVNMMFVPYG